MADYNSMKVPELKKLLTERGLPHTGNKADLIARLNENDKQKATAAEPQAGKHPSFSATVKLQSASISAPPLRRALLSSRHLLPMESNLS
jgi:SAP domain-containing ribonucleoprotein